MKNSRSPLLRGENGLLICIVWCWSVLASGQSKVGLAWDASADISVVGYRLYYGGSSRGYTNFIDVGAKTSASVPGVRQGVPYYFAVTAYDSTGLESEFSDEVAYRVPITAPQLQGVARLDSRWLMLQGVAPPRKVVTILAGTDLKSWAFYGYAVADSNGVVQFRCPYSGGSRCFYRLQ
jgi:hypothetical protein